MTRGSIISIAVGCVLFFLLACGNEEGASKEADASKLKEQQVADTVYHTVSVDRLRMRGEPTLESPTLLLLPEGVIIKTWGVRSREKIEVTLRDKRISDYWLLAKYGKQEGWVFAGAIDEVSSDPRSSTVIIAGVQVGPILKTDSEQDVINRLGKENVTRRTIPIGEGYTVQGTVVFPNSEKELVLLWSEEDFEHLHEVQIHNSESPWKTETGLQVGQSLKEVEAINEKPFTLSGWGWDYGGTTTSWNQGAISDLITVVFEEPERFHRDLEGDKSFPSDNTRMRRANPTLARMRILFE